MQNTYWNNQGKHQKAYQELTNDLMSAHGKADTLHGELLRALGKIYYDYYNNGMCNNTTGPCNFLKAKINFEGLVESAFKDIYIESSASGYTPMEMEVPLEMVADYVIEHIMSTENQPNSEDMWDLQENVCLDEDKWDLLGDVCYAG
jgi:hypothetical protein